MMRCIDGAELACNSNIADLLEQAQRLDPENAKSYNVGLVWEPAKDHSFTLDYFDTRRRYEINLLDLDLILANEGASSGKLANRIVRGPVAPGETIGPLQAVNTFYDNSGGAFVNGWDLNAHYRANVGAYGKHDNRLVLTYYANDKGNSDVNEPILEFVNYGYPRARGTFNTAWEYREFTTGLGIDYNKGYKTLRDPTLTCSAAIRAVQPSCEVASNTTYDHPFQSVYYTIGGTYRFK
jgi:iron complex outermembrane receptor protein